MQASSSVFISHLRTPDPLWLQDTLPTSSYNGSLADVSFLNESFQVLSTVLALCLTVVVCSLYASTNSAPLLLSLSFLLGGETSGKAGSEDGGPRRRRRRRQEQAALSTAQKQNATRTQSDSTDKHKPLSNQMDPMQRRVNNGCVESKNSELHQQHETNVALPTPHHHGLKHLAIIMDGNRRFGKSLLLQQQQQQQQQVQQDNSTAQSSSTTLSQLLWQATGVHNDHQQSNNMNGNHAANPSSASSSGSAPSSSSSWWSSIVSSPLNGHYAGGNKLLDVIRHCIDLRIDMLTVYAFSTENWNRSSFEVDLLMRLFVHFFEKMRTIAHEEGIFIRFVSSDLERIPVDVRERMVSLERVTRQISPRRIVVNCCVSYSGRLEVLQACERALRTAPPPPLSSSSSTGSGPEGERPPLFSLSEESVGKYFLYGVTQHEDPSWEEDDWHDIAQRGGIEPTVLLRTSGEQRLSNFLLYQAAYSELIFVEKSWPEMEKADLEKVIAEFASRQRRYGK